MADSIVPFVRGMKVGLGYDRLTGEPSTSPVVAGSSVSAIAGAGGQLVTSDCLIIQDVATLHKAVGVTADAGGAYAGFSASAKVDYLNSFDFSRFSIYVVVKVSVKNAFESVDSPAFSPDATELLETNNQARFHERFGDCFISGVQKGGEYFAIYQVSSTQQSETETTATEVRAAFGNPVAGANLHTKIETATTNSSSHLEVNVHVFRQGMVSQVDMGLEDIMKTARDFPLSVAGDKSFPFEVLLQPYARLKSPNDKFDFLQIQTKQQVLADLAKKRFEFLTLRDDYAYIMKHSKDFQMPDGSPVVREVLLKSHAQVVAAINTMEREASACSRNAGTCTFTAFDVGAFDVPVLADSPADALDARGDVAVGRDARAVQIRRDLPDAASRRGFNIAFGNSGDDSLPGPGKDRLRDSLPGPERQGFATAVSYFLVRNSNPGLVAAGEAIAKATNEVAEARQLGTDGFFWLGFDLATGLYGDPALKGQGITNPVPGPGQTKVRESLNDRGKQGFDASRTLHLGPPPLKRLA